MKDGVAAFWGGIPCALQIEGAPAPCVYRRARGVEPSTSEVSFPRSAFGASLAPALDPRRFQPPEGSAPDALALLAQATPSPRPVADRPPYFGDLWLVQGSGAEQRTCVARALYFDQAVIATPRLDDPLVVVTLSDIRKWWSQHGEITRSWNVRLPSNLQLGSGTVGRRFVARTSKANGSQPYSLREIVAELLRDLPGSLPIVRWPAGVGEGAQAPEVRCRAARPKEALRGCLDAFRLQLDIGPDLKARVFRVGEGEIGELAADGEDNASAYDPLSREGAWAGEGGITADGNRYARRPTGAPTEVLVVGDATIFDVRLDSCRPVLTYTLDAPTQGGAPETVVLEVTPENLAALARGLRQPEGRVGIAPGLSGNSPEFSGDQATPLNAVLPDPLDRHALNVILGVPNPELPAVIPIHRGPRNLTRTESVEAPGGAGRRLPPGPVFRALPPGVNKGVQTLVEPAGGNELGAEPPRPASSPDPFVWQRIPLLDEDAWERVLEWLPLTTRKVVRDQLWRYYQIPIARYAPILARAERTADGDRLEFTVEAFAFRMVRVREPVARESDADIQAAEDRALLGALLVDLARNQALIKLLADPDLSDAWTDMVRPWQWGEDPGLEANSERARERLREVGRGWLEAWIAFAEDVRPGEGQDLDAAARTFYAQLRADLGRAGLGSGRTRDQQQELLRLATERVEDLERKITEAQRKVNPRGVLEKEIGVLEGRIRAIREATGEDPPDLVELRDQTQKALADLASGQAEKDKAIAAARPDWHEFYRCENLSRHTVAARIVDKARGIFEVLGDLPCWVADTKVKHPTATYLIPMPVAVIFGSTCRDDPDRDGRLDLSEDTPRVNPYMAVAETMIGAASAAAKAAMGEIGSTVPRDGDGGFPIRGERHARLSFQRDGDDSGDETLTLHPWVEVMDESPPFRELVRLDGSSNRADLVERALPIARALLDTPDDTDAGSIVLACPRTVGANGRISAVEVRLVGAGEGFVTEVSFDGDVHPLPDQPGRARDGGPLRLSFGIDTEATQDR